MSEYIMDELDNKILDTLEAQGYKKPSDLAPLIGVGERTIYRRIAKMRTEELIKFVAIPNIRQAGYKAWAKIGIKVTLGEAHNVARALMTHPSVYFVAYSIGAFDVFIGVRFRTTDGLSYFVNSELTKIKGIKSTEVLLLIGPKKYYNFIWPTPDYSKNRDDEYVINEIDNKVNSDIDSTDKKILQALIENGPVSTSALKSKLGFSEWNIRQRLKKLWDNQMYKIIVIRNANLTKYEAWGTMGITTDQKSANEVLENVTKIPAVYLASLTLGRFNILISVRFHNMDILGEFVQVELPRIPGISSVETFLHSKPLKYHNYYWWYRYESPSILKKRLSDS
jgi:DNA-binding Lrp family transcriptional regulator